MKMFSGRAIVSHRAKNWEKIKLISSRETIRDRPKDAYSSRKELIPKYQGRR